MRKQSKLSVQFSSGLVRKTPSIDSEPASALIIKKTSFFFEGESKSFESMSRRSEPKNMQSPENRLRQSQS
jgi:hypothetical protein